MLSQPIDCLGVVLAGGLSSRMGEDKAQLSRLQKSTKPSQYHETKSQPNMLDFSKQLLRDAGINNVIVSGDNHQVPDLIPHSGPVGGIYSVLAHYPEHLQPKSLLILPVDLPLMTPEAIVKLRLTGELSNKACFFQEEDNRAHHIPLYLPNNVYLNLFLNKAFGSEKTINDSKNSPQNNQTNKKHGPSVRSMLKEVPHQAIGSLNKHNLFNTNTPQEWQQAQKILNNSI